MIKISEASLGVDISDVAKIQQELNNEQSELQTLEFIIKCERAIRTLEGMKINLIKQANTEYTRRSIANGHKPLKFEDAILTDNSGRATWIYPKELVAAENKLKEDKKIAQVQKLAVKREGELNPATHFLFKIQTL